MVLTCPSAAQSVPQARHCLLLGHAAHLHVGLAGNSSYSMLEFRERATEEWELMK